jgi:hypothetical protein
VISKNAVATDENASFVDSLLDQNPIDASPLIDRIMKLIRETVTSTESEKAKKRKVEIVDGLVNELSALKAVAVFATLNADSSKGIQSLMPVINTIHRALKRGARVSKHKKFKSLVDTLNVLIQRGDQRRARDQ